MKDAEHMYTAEEGEGQTCTVVCTDKDLAKAKQNAIRIIDAIDLPGKDYRIDIGEKVMKNLKQLKDWGWI
jgi:phosphoribosylamine-glycine ligase